MFTVKTAAEILGNISEATVYSLCQRKLLGHVRIGAGRGVIRIRQGDIDAYLRNREVEPTPSAPPPLPQTPAKLKHLTL